MINNLPAWFNGKFCEIKDLNFSVLDLGFIHCDATYDVIAVHDKKIFMLDYHLDRFYKSAEHWKLDIKFNKEEISDVIKILCQKSNLDDSLVWIGITRGIPTSGSPRDLVNCSSNIFIYVKPYFNFNEKNSASVCISNQIRIPDYAINQKYKNFAWNDLTLAQWEAIDRGFDTAILLDINGNITEGPGFGIFGLTDDFSIITPKNNCLESITIKIVEQICDEESMIFERKNISVNEIMKCKNVCLASTAGHIISVNRLENLNYIEEDIILKIIRLNLEKRKNEREYSTTI